MKTAVIHGLLLANLASAAEYYFDGSATSSGSGTTASPFNKLDSIATLSLKPGDGIFLKRGTSFTGPLHLTTSGSAGSPITIGAYGTAAGLPKVASNPTAQNGSSVLLEGTSHVTLQDLEITNIGANSTARRGVYLYAKDAGAVSGVIMQRLNIHDVTGRSPGTAAGAEKKDQSTISAVGKFAGASGGIIIEAAGNTNPTWFEDITVINNVIRSSGRQGIYTWSNWCRRPELIQYWYQFCNQPWHASTGLKVANNSLSDIYGDGIVIHGNIDAQATSNVLNDFHTDHAGASAGIWTANSIGTYFAYNTVSGGQTTQDGMAYDVDHSTSGTLYEYNLSHDNAGGFFLLCPYTDKASKNFTIRYNLSINDKARAFEICAGNLTGGRIYKNTILVGSAVEIFTLRGSHSIDVKLSDNIVHTTGSGHGSWNISSSEFVVNNNMFSGNIDAFASATNDIAGTPEFVSVGSTDPKAYILKKGSAALDAAVTVLGDASKDFFGNPITHQNLGFYAGAGQ